MSSSGGMARSGGVPVKIKEGTKDVSFELKKPRMDTREDLCKGMEVPQRRENIVDSQPQNTLLGEYTALTTINITLKEKLGWGIVKENMSSQPI